MTNEVENTLIYLLIVEYHQSIPQYLQAPFPVVKTASNAGSMGSIPGWGANIVHASRYVT